MQLGSFPHLRQGQIRESQDGEEQIVEIVGDAAGQAPDGLHPLGMDGQPASVAAMQETAQVRIFRVDRRGDQIRIRRVADIGGGPENRVHLHPDHFLLLALQNGEGGTVAENHPVLIVQKQEAFGNVLGDRLQYRQLAPDLAATHHQLDFRQLAGGDVHQRHDAARFAVPADFHRIGVHKVEAG